MWFLEAFSFIHIRPGWVCVQLGVFKIKTLHHYLLTAIVHAFVFLKKTPKHLFLLWLGDLTASSHDVVIAGESAHCGRWSHSDRCQVYMAKMIESVRTRLACVFWPLQIGFNGFYFTSLWSGKWSAFAWHIISSIWGWMIWPLLRGFYQHSIAEICPLSS